MAARDRRSTKDRNQARHHRRDTDRVVRWLQAGAVVTGVSAAVISGQGSAWAATDGDADTSTDATAADTGTTTESVGAPATDPAAGPATDTTNTVNAQGEVGTDPTDTPPNSQTVAAGDSPPVTISAQTNVSSGSEEETEEGQDEEEEILEDAAETGGAETPMPPVGGSNRRATDTNPPAQRFVSRFSVTQRPTSRTVFDDSPVQIFSAATTTMTALQTTPALIRPPTATVVVTNVGPPQNTSWRPIRELVLGALGAFGFSPNPAPGAPTPNPLLEAIWGLYRRTESTFSNQRPTVKGATVTNTELTGQGQVIITGAVDFDDPDGDRMLYRSTSGDHGTVAVNNDGTFTYTPTDPEFTGTDTFTITASDIGPHLHGLVGLITPRGGHTRTATISINLTAAPNDAPVINQIFSDPGVGNSWTVTVDATDPDDDPLTITLAAFDADHVTVTPVAGSPNKFTVTVTDTDWALANPGKQLTVTATATDGLATSAPDTLAIGTVTNVIGLGISVPALPAGLTYTKFSAYDNSILLIRSDGTVIALGSNSSGQLNIPPQNEGVIYTAVASGGAHTVLLRADGTAFTTGWNLYGQLAVPELAPGVTIKQIGAGYASSVYLLSDGTVRAYGLWTEGLASLPPLPAGVTYTQIYIGDTSNFLLRSDGKVDAFGYNNFQKLVIPPLPAGLTYTQVGAGVNHTLFLHSDGTVVSSGINGAGQRNIPPLPEGVTYTQVAGGLFHTVLLRSDGTAVAVSTQNARGQLNIPSLPDGIVYTHIGAGLENTLLMIDYA